MNSLDCPYCQKRAELVTGEGIYPHRPDLFQKRFWLCRPCGAWVGCHPGTTRPLGRIANAELRRWKQAAHAAFDPLWQTKQMTRPEAYKFLQELMHMTPEQAHIGMFDVIECKLLIEKLELRTPLLYGKTTEEKR